MKKFISFFQHLSINAKVILAYLCFVAVIGGAGTLLVALNEQAVIQQEHIALARNIAENVSPMLVVQHKVMLNRVVNIVGNLANVRDCAIVNHAGLALAHTDLARVGATMPVGPAAQRAFKEQGYLFFTIDDNQIEGVYAPVVEAGEYLGSVLITFDSTDILGLLTKPRVATARIILSFILFAALFGFFGAIIITRLISYPIRVLTEKIYDVLQGNFPARKLPINYVFCWEKLGCRQLDCPSYMNKEEKCWAVAGTFCRGEMQGVHAHKIGDCRQCVVYRKNSGDELERLNDGFDIMVRELVDHAESMKCAKDDIESYAKELEKANRENVEMRIYHEQILDSLSAAVVSLDENLIIRKYNQAAQAILGVALAELVGSNIAEVQKDCSRCADFFGIILQAIQRYQQDGRPLMGHEVAVPRLSGGSIVIRLSVLPFMDRIFQEKTPMIVTFEDITEQEKMRAELNLSRNLAELGEVAAKVAHDVRNPLNAIEGGIHYLITSYADDPEIQNISNLIRGQVTRLNRVTRDLLKVSKPLVSNFSVCNLNQLVEESAGFLFDAIRHGGLTLEKELSAEIPPVVIDPNQMQRAIINLMENAIEATSAGGGITLRTRLLVNPEALDWVELTVADTGQGIPPENLDAVLKPFYTTKVHGTGLGLSIVKQVVTLHQGDLVVRARRAGPGTEIVIHLPVRIALAHQEGCHV